MDCYSLVFWTMMRMKPAWKLVKSFDSFSPMGSKHTPVEVYKFLLQIKKMSLHEPLLHSAFKTSSARPSFALTQLLVTVLAPRLTAQGLDVIVDPCGVRNKVFFGDDGGFAVRSCVGDLVWIFQLSHFFFYLYRENKQYIDNRTGFIWANRVEGIQSDNLWS